MWEVGEICILISNRYLLANETRSNKPRSEVTLTRSDSKSQPDRCCSNNRSRVSWRRDLSKARLLLRCCNQTAPGFCSPVLTRAELCLRVFPCHYSKIAGNLTPPLTEKHTTNKELQKHLRLPKLPKRRILTDVKWTWRLLFSFWCGSTWYQRQTSDGGRRGTRSASWFPHLFSGGEDCRR